MDKNDRLSKELSDKEKVALRRLLLFGKLKKLKAEKKQGDPITREEAPILKMLLEDDFFWK